MSLKTDILEEVLEIEGGFSDNVHDSGGATRFGITESLARIHGYKGRMADLPAEFALEVYDKEFWRPLYATEIADISPRICREMVDTAINMGVSTAVTFLQRSLNALNNRETLYRDLRVDGIMGTRTIAALRSYTQIRENQHGDLVLFRCLNCLQGEKYLRLAESRVKDEEFVYGWMLNRVG